MFGFPVTLRRLISHCVTTSSLSVLWNGDRTEFFKPSKGLRQGDPLSPYMFVIYLERLSMSINKAVEEKKWKTFPMSRGGPQISLLLFADDLLFFGKANEQHIKCMGDVMNRFSAESGHSFSSEKSIAHGGPRVTMGIKDKVHELLGIQFTESIEKYLGVPNNDKRVTGQTYI